MTTTPITLQTIVSFILRNRRGTKAFIGWSVPQIEDAVHYSIVNECMCVDVTPDGNAVTGVVLGKPNSESKTIHIMGALSIKRCALVRFFSWYKQHYNGWKLTATRRGRSVCYSVSKLEQKLL